MDRLCPSIWDRTPEIADEYERKYPGICRAVHQENGGHGQAVNTGLKNATGVFFKVVDSDDWVNEEAYQKVLETLRAAKTGTAEFETGKETHAWFTGFAPVESPKIVVTVLVEESGSGGKVAGPIARQLFDIYMSRES